MNNFNRDKQVERAIQTLKQMSDKEQDKLKKIDIDYVITVLTGQAYGRMPF
ncbi:hypothetical protein [Bacillus cereus group sp. BfR-BA-01424]|uniref:hypothetical protein n=1 Tax=Bacillus cereus group sp. BfR-BA-01424 TaxID=2920341 RepID=UPI001F5A3424